MRVARLRFLQAFATRTHATGALRWDKRGRLGRKWIEFAEIAGSDVEESVTREKN